MATHSSTLAWKTPQMEEPSKLQSMGSQRVTHDWTTSLLNENRYFMNCKGRTLILKEQCPYKKKKRHQSSLSLCLTASQHVHRAKVIWGPRRQPSTNQKGLTRNQPCCYLNPGFPIFRTIRRSIQFSRSVVSNSLRPPELQHARPPCPSPTPGFHPNPRPSCRWCHPAILSSVDPFSSCPQSLPASESFPMSQLFAWDDQSTGVSALASFLLKNTQDWSPWEWTGWISLQSKGLSRLFSNTTVQKHQFFGTQFSSQSNTHIHIWPLEKP